MLNLIFWVGYLTNEIMSMKRGVVKFYSTDSKYGFIKPDDGSKDVFVHQNDLKTSGIEIKKNQKVEYELASRKEKVFAINVKIID
jgi:CspA family cold shock protein